MKQQNVPVRVVVIAQFVQQPKKSESKCEIQTQIADKS